MSFEFWLISAGAWMLCATIYINRPSFEQFTFLEQVIFICCAGFVTVLPFFNTLAVFIVGTHLWVTRDVIVK